MARYLTLAFFYDTYVDSHETANNKKMTHHEAIVAKFLNMVQIHYKKESGLEFYANKLFVSPKHLSKVIKQISDELNFPSQSFFGKYFKRVTGMSPKEYKAKG